MENTMRRLADLIRAELCESKTTLAPLSPEETKALYTLAKRHEVAHIAANAAIRCALLPESEKAKAVFEKECFTTLYRYKDLCTTLAELKELLEGNAIVHIPLKGSVLRDLYPTPWMRNSCDIDILVREADIPRAKELLLAAGYTSYSATAHDVSFDSPRGVHLELHFRLLEDGVSDTMQRVLTDVWSHATPKAGALYEHVLSDDFFYYYHIAHMAKHYLHGGCGIRPFLDLWMLRHRIFFDEERRNALLKAGGLLSFAKAAESLSEVWFGEESHTPITEKMEAFVLSGGVYGSEENRITVGQVRRGGKLGYALSRIFLPYHTIKYHYPVLQKHKWLLPFCEVRRWCKLIFLGGARRSAKELRTNSAIDANIARDIKHHISDLGL